MGLSNFKYDKIIPFMFMNYTIAILNGKAGLIDIEGNQLTEFIYDDLSEYYKKSEGDFEWTLLSDNDFCSMRKNGKWGILDNCGNTIIDFKYDEEIEIVEFSKNCYQVYLDGKYILCDKNFKNKTNIVFDELLSCNKNYFKYRLNDKWGIVSKNGILKTDVKFDYIDSFVNKSGLIKASKSEGKYGVINLNGETILDFIYKDLSVEGDIVIAKSFENDCFGVIDLNKNVILDFIYSKIYTGDSVKLDKTVLLAEYKNKWAMFNTKGKQLS